MAKKKPSKKSEKKSIRRRSKLALWVFCLLFCLLAVLFGWMWSSAHITHLCSASVYLEDLPAAFDGTTILYISDFNIQSKSDDRQAARLMKKLNTLNVDMLLLGGDYTASSAMEIFSSTSENVSHETNLDHTSRAEQFISSLAAFNAPLGKFAVVGEEDQADVLAPLFASSGVQLLSDACVTVEKENAQLVIAGLSDVSEKKTPYTQIGGCFSGEECVIALAHNPSAYIGVRVAEARGGGAWADLVLSGHTLGGQIKIGNRTIRTMPEEEARCISGWYYENDLPMLVSSGLGCKTMKLRLGTQSEVWLITLRRPHAKTLPRF